MRICPTSIRLSQSLKTLADVIVGRFWLLDLRKRSTEHYPCCGVFDRSDITLKSVNPKAVWNNNSTFRGNGYQRSFCDLFSNFELTVCVNGRVRVTLCCRNVWVIHQSTGVLGLDSPGWDLNKEILTGSRPGRLRDPRLKFLPCCSIWRCEEGWGRRWEDCQIWWNDWRSLVRQETTQS